MKELSIEEKAKAYDKKLAEAKEMLEDGGISQNIIDYIQKLYPELAESEDERIIKAIKSAVLQLTDIYLQEKYGLKQSDCIAWLEKQGEQANFRNKIQIGDKVTRNKDGVLVNLSQLKRVAKKDEKQGEQKCNEEYNITGIKSKNAEGKLGEMIMNLKSVNEVLEQKPLEWSEEDEKIYQSIMDDTVQESQLNDKQTNWLRDIKYRHFQQPKKEWSEEDECCRNQLIIFCENCMVKDTNARRCADWLKSLRPQSTWRPSDKQLEALKEACDKHWEPDGLDPLYTLYQELKKLRKE